MLLLLRLAGEGVELREQLGRHRRRDQALALHDRVDGGRHLFRRDVLQQVAVGAGLDRLIQIVLLVGDGEHEDLGAGQHLPDAPGGFDPVDPGHAYVHEHHIWGQPLGLGDGGLPVLRLGDHLDVLLRTQHDVEAATEQRLVVGDQDPNRPGCRRFTHK